MDVAALRAPIDRLALIDRASCSPGEHEAAEWIAATLRDLGADARVEQHRVHGTYWVPLGVTSALGILSAAATRRRRRGLAVLLGTLGTLGVFDELGAGRRVLRSLLPKQTTANVVAEIGDPAAERTLIICSHHDAAHTGIFWDPRIAEFIARRMRSNAGGDAPDLLAPMAPVAAAPAATALAGLLGSRRLAGAGAFVCAGIIASFAHIATSATVPGANDNLTGVATVIAIARALREQPVDGLRVLLVSTGSEESLMEGMRAFARRHFPSLDFERTHLLCVDCVGSPHLTLAEAEGMLNVRDYDPAFEQLVADSAEELGIPLRRGFRMRLGTDGYLALRAGLPAALIMSDNDIGMASNYHWPTDTPDRVDYATLADAVRLCEHVMRRLAGSRRRRDPELAAAGHTAE